MPNFQTSRYSSSNETDAPLLSLFEQGSVRLSDTLPSEPVLPVWFGIYRGQLTLFVGETGAGKSSLFRQISLHAALNKPLWNRPFGLDRPINVLYIDPENMGDAAKKDGGLTASRMDGIGQGRPENLLLHSGILGDGKPMNLSDSMHMEALKSFIEKHKIDLAILDPYAILFPSENENDNSEATKRANPLKRLALETGCAIVLCHHTGKLGEENASQAKFGRGASSLLGAADVGITLRLKSPLGVEANDDDGVTTTQQRNDYVRLKIEKNRPGFDNTSIYLQMVGNGNFRRVSRNEYLAANQPVGRDEKRETQSTEAQNIILEILKDGRSYDRSMLIKSAKSHKISGANAMAALNHLKDTAAISEQKGERGKLSYRLPAVERASEKIHSSVASTAIEPALAPQPIPKDIKDIAVFM